MLRRYCLLAVSLLLALVWMQISVVADNETGDDNETEEAIAFSQLPAAVQDAVKTAYPKAEIGKCVEGAEDGEVTYEVALKGGRLLESELITEEGATTYEVEVKCGAAVLELTMDDSGRVLAIAVDDDEHEGDDEDEDGDE